MNPLLSRAFLIPFDEVRPEHVEPAISQALTGANRALKQLTERPDRSYATTIQALDDLQERLDRVVGMTYHLNSVATSPEFRAAFNKMLPEFSAFYAQLPTNESLWQAIKDYAETDEAKALSGVKKRYLDKVLREFRRSGADLEGEAKRRVEAIRVELSQLHSKFAENVLDATNAFELVITDEADLAGLPETVKAQARADAKAKDKAGYRFTLQAPSYMPFMKYAENRALRKLMYEAYVSRASEGELDNRPLILNILALRQELAERLGYANFADYRLERNMIKSGEEAQAFIADLFETTTPYWQRDVDMLTQFALQDLGLKTLEAWDLSFATERLRKARYDFDDEDLRPYFPVDQVLKGLFEISGRLFGIRVSERSNPKVWDEAVKFYDIHNEAGTHLGSFYADWYPRENKRAGAWMNRFITGGPAGEDFEPHLGLMCGNFAPPQDGKPALLSHREVQTTFHEFGHLLHHCLSSVEVRALAGTNVPRDFVELPSQLMENWTWEREALDLFARHHETGETIPAELFEKMQRARTFMEANAQMRQLSYGAVDLALHIDYVDHEDDVIAFANDVMRPFVIRPEFADNYFLTAFSHVFTGGYAAGYYSYKWSEVLDADAFSRFEKEGIFNRETGQAYLETILSRGDSADPEELYREFMGRDPDLSALTRRNLGPDTPAMAGN